jgi:hypothetical protein
MVSLSNGDVISSFLAKNSTIADKIKDLKAKTFLTDTQREKLQNCEKLGWRQN